MFVMIAGCGHLGAGLACVLSSHGNDVVVVSDAIDLKLLGNDFDGVTVTGSPIDRDVLASAGIRKAELFVAATPDDAVNAMAVQIAAGIFHVPKVLARITDPGRESFYRSIGIRTVCPTSTGINQVLDLILGSTFFPLEGTLDPGLAGVVPPAEWFGKRMSELRLPAGRRLAGLLRDGVMHGLDTDYAVEPGDTLVLLRTPRAPQAGRSRRTRMGVRKVEL